MMVGTWMRQKIATSAASGMWIGSGMKQMASPAPNARRDRAPLQRPQARIGDARAEDPQKPAVLQLARMRRDFLEQTAGHEGARL